MINNPTIYQSSKLDFRIYWPENFKIRIFIYILFRFYWKHLAKVTGPNQFSLAVGHRTTAKVDDWSILLLFTASDDSFWYLQTFGITTMLILGYFEVTAGVSAIVMVFSATFKNMSVISWLNLKMEETGVPGENYRPVSSHWLTLSHTVVSSTPRHERGSNSNSQR